MRVVNFLFGVVVAAGLVWTASLPAAATGFGLQKQIGTSNSIIPVNFRECIREVCGGKRWRRNGYGSRAECKEIAAARICAGEYNGAGGGSRDACIVQYCVGGQWRQHGFSDEFHCMENCR